MTVARQGFGALLLTLGCVFAARAATPEGMQRLEMFLDKTRSLQADFRQEIVRVDETGAVEVLESAAGRVVLKRPGRFRWDYRTPYERAVVADGEQLWLYEADLDQVTVRPLAHGLSDTPAALLSGERSALDHFEFVKAWSGENLHWVTLKPRAADADFDAVTIAFTGDKPAQFDLSDRLGQHTRIYFEQVKINAPVADTAFHFEVPAGVDVIREAAP